MREDIKKAMARMARRSREGVFGTEARAAARECTHLGALTALTEFVEQVVGETTDDDPTSEVMRDLALLLVSVYPAVVDRNAEVARAYVESLAVDYPDTKGTALWSRYEGLMNSTFAFKQVATSENRLLVWQQTKDLVRTYNEFLNGLLGYLLIMVRCALGKPFRAGTFKAAYGTKADQFSRLTGGEDNIFFLFHRLARPMLRNAIAHDDIEFDEDGAIVTYTDRKRDRTTMPLAEFVTLAAVGARLGQAYFAAIATIIVVSDGDPKLVRRLPDAWVHILTKAPR